MQGAKVERDGVAGFEIVGGNVEKRAIKQHEGDVLRGIVEELIHRALRGEAWTIKEIADRLDGPRFQQMEMAGTDREGLTISVVQFGNSRFDSGELVDAEQIRISERRFSDRR